MPRFSPQTIRIIRTCNLYLSFFGLGMCVAIPGPTLMDLEKNVGTDTQHISYIYAARSGAYLGGSVIGGILFDRFNRQCLIIVSIFISGLSTLIIPWWSSLLPLLLSMVVSGLSMGAIDTGGGVLCLDIWKENPSPYLQALHFMFGAGAFVAPLIAEPFLSPIVHINSTNNALSLTNATLTVDEGYYIIHAYAIAGGYVFIVGLSCIFMYLVDPSDVPSNIGKSRPTSSSGNGYLPNIAIGLACTLVSVYVVLEMSYSQFLSSFVVRSKHQMTKSMGSYVTSVFWCAFMLSRGMAIFFATRFSSFNMLFANITLVNLAAILLSLWGESSERVLWVGTVVLGFGMAPIYPSAFAWMEKYSGISNKIAAMFQATGTIGGTFSALVIGRFIEESPMCVMYMSLGCSLTFVVIFSFQWWLRNLFRQKRIYKADIVYKTETLPAK